MFWSNNTGDCANVDDGEGTEYIVFAESPELVGIVHDSQYAIRTVWSLVGEVADAVNEAIIDMQEKAEGR